MNKIEIEVPENKVGKVTKQDNGNILIEFEDENSFNGIETVTDAICYLQRKGLCEDLLEEYVKIPIGSYSDKITKYRIVVAALTNGKTFSLTNEEMWYPLVQFCEIGKEDNCLGDEIIGTIASEGKMYTVVGGYAGTNSYEGLGNFNKVYEVSFLNNAAGIFSVPTAEIAKYISKQFGELVFEIRYYGANWKWIV